MLHGKSQVRPGLGAALSAVYGVTPESADPRIPRLAHELIPRLLGAIRAKVSRRQNKK